ncbi:MAG: class I SAM-dependent rRNA methyltransferase [Leptospira sp.]|nr:class I SAM-dependent rRNA methyltransferase [Leptospira sp.]
MVVRLKKGKEKALTGFHPWVFSGAIEGDTKTIPAGSIVRIESYSGEFLAYGHFDPTHQIRIRVFSFNESEDGSDANFWNLRFLNVYSYKKQLLSESTNGYRLFFSEADGLPGIIVDCYADSAVLLLNTPGAKRLRELLVQFLSSHGYPHIVEKIETPSGKSKWEWQLGSKEGVKFLEHGIHFVIQFSSAQKTGFFLDQRENRKLLGDYAKGKKVLNTFSYSGGFSLYALKAGASLVHSVDISEDAISLCDTNLKENGLETKITEKVHHGFAMDSFQFLKDMPHSFYDLIVLDPPAFAKSSGAVLQATKGYKEINLKAISKLAPGGILFTFSCSKHISKDLFQKIVFGAAKDAKRNARILHHLSQSSDHAPSIFHPEGEYLKGLVIQVD